MPRTRRLTPQCSVPAVDQACTTCNLIPKGLSRNKRVGRRFQWHSCPTFPTKSGCSAATVSWRREAMVSRAGCIAKVFACPISFGAVTEYPHMCCCLVEVPGQLNPRLEQAGLCRSHRSSMGSFRSACVQNHYLSRKAGPDSIKLRD